MSEIGLKVEGKEYRGWLSVHVTRSIEAGAGKFALAFTDRWEQASEPWPIFEEDECVVTVDGKPVITGWVDTRGFSLSSTDHTMTVEGRDRVGALVDCSAVLDQWEFKTFNILQLASKVAQPFGIKVSLQPGVPIGTPADKLTIDPGEKAFEVIEKACRLVGLLPVSDGLGGLLLTRAGNARATTSIVEGKNFLSGTSKFDATGRYHDYLVVGQHSGKKNRKAGVQIKGSAVDDSVRRKERVLVVRPEHACTPEQANKRAQWEATVRAARGDTVDIPVQGWTQADGTVWPINALVDVQAPSLGIHGPMLCTGTELSLDSGGEITQLSLRNPDAFRPEAKIRKGGGNNYWKEIKAGV